MGLHRDGEFPVERVAPFGETAPQAVGVLAEALARARTGDETAIRVLYRQLNPPLLRYLRHFVGQEGADLASEVWMALAAQLANFEGTPASFRALMFTVAHRRVVDYYRRSRRQVPTVSADEEDDRTGGNDAEDRALDRLTAQRAVRMLVEELPRDQAEIVLLRVLGDLDVAQVAAILGKTPGAVRIAQHRALRHLQRRWERSAVTP